MFQLADRLHKTPREIREGFTLDDLEHFLAHVRLEEDEVAATTPRR